MIAPSSTIARATVPTSERRFEALFEAEFPYVWTSLRRLGVPERDLEDVTHDVLFEVYRKLDAYDSTRPLRPWLFAFAFRFASDYRRLARHRVEVIDTDTEGVSPVQAADDGVAEGETRVLVMRALESIDLKRRAVFVLHELDERSMPEVAEALEIPLQTGYSRLHEARKEFAAAVRRLRGRAR